MQRRQQIALAVGLALALHVSAAVTAVGYTRYLIRHSTATTDLATAAILEWLATAPADLSDKLDMSDMSAPAVARPLETERMRSVAAKEPTASAIHTPMALPTTEALKLAPTTLPMPSEKSDLPTLAATSSPEPERILHPLVVGLQTAAANLSALNPWLSSAPASDIQMTAAGGPYPVALAEIHPRYPRSARSQGQEGRVVVWAEIDDTGHSERLEVSESSGHPTLDKAAMDAVRRAHFRPATRAGQPVPGEIRMPFEFRLQ